jgi:hypothetical protein
MELRPSGQVADLWGRFVAELCARLAQDGAAGLDLDGLAQMGLDEELVEWLRSLIDEYHPEGDLVAVFLFEVVSGLPAGRVNRDVVRRLRKESRRVTQAGGWAALQREMATRVSGGSRARA